VPCDELDVAAADAKVRQILVIEAFQFTNGVAEDEPRSDFGENKRSQQRQGTRKRATNGCRLSGPVLQVRVATHNIGLHLTRLSSDSANKAEKGQENHDKPPAENLLPWIAQEAAIARSPTTGPADRFSDLQEAIALVGLGRLGMRTEGHGERHRWHRISPLA
jgi:hypothetical protein